MQWRDSPPSLKGLRTVYNERGYAGHDGFRFNSTGVGLGDNFTALQYAEERRCQSTGHLSNYCDVAPKSRDKTGHRGTFAVIAA